jgi:hypothetical protein
MKIIYSGLESSGKSLRLAMMCVKLVYRNSKWLQTSGVVRPIVSNLRFSEEFYKWAVDEMKVPIMYWENLDDLVKYEQCDVIIDEVGNYFDSHQWQDLSLDVRKWLTQGAKCGIEVYGSAQDFAQVDKSFRRLTNFLYEIRKIVGSPRPSATRPPVERIWGVCLSRELDPRSYNEDKKKFASSISVPSLFFIQRRYCEIFDTTQKIIRGSYPALRHEERHCDFPNCGFEKVYHI